MRSNGGHKAGCHDREGVAWVAEYAQAVRRGSGKIASCRIHSVGKVLDLDLGEQLPVLMAKNLTLT